MDDRDPFDGDEDAALRYAIALSLQEPGNGSPISASAASKPIDIISDDDGDDLDQGPSYPPTPKKLAHGRPFATNGASASEVPRRPSKPSASRDSATSAPSEEAPTGLAALGLDRKSMEAERLARLAAKRKAPSSASEDTGEHRRQRIKVDAAPESKSQDSSRLPYPKGVVKKTWAKGYSRRDDITIDEVLQKDQLELAVLSSFQWDEDFMASKIDLRRTKVVCIAFASSEAQKEEMRNNVSGSQIKFCFPPMMPFGTMHSKLQLLKYPTYLRVVIPTGNLVPYDWGETGVMENMLFLIDLPRITDPAEWTSNSNTLFHDELCYYLKAQGLDDALLSSLSKYDFSETDRYRFVHTIGQTRVGNDWQRTGYCGLGRAVKSLHLDTPNVTEVDYVAASLGSINTDLIDCLFNAAKGDDGLKEYNKRNARGRKKSAPAETEELGRDHFRVYFPSHETVTASRGGKGAAGTICAQKKWWESASFPRELFRDCKSVRKGLLMHSKIMFVRHLGVGSGTAWAYLGSANLSESAWGRLVKDKATGQPKLNCRNWECGVLIPAPAKGHVEDGTQVLDLSVFEGTVPVPMEVPAEAYGAEGSKKPWLFLEN
ncbi:phospholipase D/nuclease [Xylariaceae sp. FL0804]|nr:phospholipase D/nuclease [Xylariaceae sp. FL0804]